MYLKAPEITVELLHPSEENEILIENAINAESANTIEIHNRQTHVEAPGESRIALRFDLQNTYNIKTVHFWNFWDEASNWNVDEMTLTFIDLSEANIGEVILTPHDGYEDIAAEDFPVDFRGVHYIEVDLRSNVNRLEFMNIGFTGVPVDALP